MTVTIMAAPDTGAQVDDLFLQSVLAGLSADQKTLESKWLYDEAGSALFDDITDLEAYYPTRTETAILRDRLGRLAERVAPGTALLELGSGSSVKTRLVLDQVPGIATYLPVDISETHLLAATARIASDYPEISMRPIVGDFTQSIVVPAELTEAPKLLFFPGSTIGNFDTDGAAALLARCHDIPNVERFLIGFDLIKDTDTLIRAYDDELGVTAAFNLNLLVRINRELGADFDIAAFEHEARWNAEKNRIEMHLVSLKAQTVRLAGKTIALTAGETIHTENSHKYAPEGFEALANLAGWCVEEVWTDAAQLFAVSTLVPNA